MKRYIHIVFAFLMVLLNMHVQSQDIHFSQTWMTPLFLNPAQAGAENWMRGFINYRNQWGSVASPYATSAISFDMQLQGKEKNSSGFHGVGVTVFHDNAGDAISITQANLMYAYHVRLSDNSTLGAGLFGGFVQRSLDLSGLQWMKQFNGSNYDPGLPTGEQVTSTSFSQFDLGAGLHYAFGKGERYMTANDIIRYNAGVAVHHVNRPQNSFYDSGEKLDMKITGYSNALIGIGNSNIAVLPGIIFLSQGKASELIFGSRFRYSLKDESKYTGFEHAAAFSLGVHYRTQDAVITSLLYEVSYYGFGLSYDFNTSGLSNASNGKGGLELTFRITALKMAKVTPQNN